MIGGVLEEDWNGIGGNMIGRAVNGFTISKPKRHSGKMLRTPGLVTARLITESGG